MALRMKSACERCTESLPEQAEAFICSYECTFCSDCAVRMSLRCPNCGGELVRRPRRERSSGESRQG
jgi:hypothetical protein